MLKLAKRSLWCRLYLYIFGRVELPNLCPEMRRIVSAEACGEENQDTYEVSALKPWQQDRMLPN